MHLSKQGIVAFAFFSLIFFHFCENSSCSSSQDWPKHPEPPRLTLLSDLNDVQRGKADAIPIREYYNDRIPLNNKTLALQCTASYPVYFDFVPSSTNIYKIFNYLNTTQYNETLVIWHSSPDIYTAPARLVGRSGNYTCRSGLDKNISTSMYIHVRDAADLFGVDPEYSSYSRVVEDKYWAIPCPAHVTHFDNVSLYLDHVPTNLILNSSRDSTISSYQTSDEENGSSGNSSQATQMNYTAYDPKYGFLLSKSEYSRPQGHFTCLMRLRNNTDIAYVILKNFTVIPPQREVTYKNNNTFQVTCEADENIRIDYSKSPFVKEISSFRSKSQYFNYSLTYVFEEETNSTIFMKNMNLSSVHYLNYLHDGMTQGIIQCVSVDSSKVLHSWTHDAKGLCTCFQTASSAVSVSAITGETDVLYSSYYSDSDGTRPKFTCNSVIAYSYQNVFLATTETKSKTSVLENYYDLQPPSERTTYSPEKDYSTYPYRVRKYRYAASLVSCALGTITTYKTLVNAVATPSGYEFNPIQMDPSQNLKIYQKTRDKLNYFVGDDIEITCVVSRYLFYNGSIKWAFNYKNGTSISLSLNQTGIARKISKTVAYGTNLLPHEWGYVDSILMEITRSLQSVSCSATVWNSTEIAMANFTLSEYADLEGSPKHYTAQEIQHQWCNQTTDQPVIIMERKLNYEIIRLNGRLKWNVVTNLNVTMPLGYSSVNLYCVAEYPMEWTFQGDDMSVNAIRVDSIVKIENITKDFYSPCFKSMISVSANMYGSTGEYKCGKRDNNALSSSVYIYAKDSSGVNRLLNAGGHLYVAVDENVPTTILPCRVTHPDVVVELYFHEAHNSHYRKLNQPEFISFDPRKGFLMSTSELNISAVYICSMKNSTAPQHSVTLSIISALDDTEKAYTMMNKTMHRMDHMIRRMSGSINKMQIVQLAILLIILTGLTALTWFIRKHLKDNENARKLKSYRYSQLNNSL